MKLIENIDVLILEPSDIIERFRSEFEVANLSKSVKYFNLGTYKKVLTASLVLFIADDGTTTILKNRYGKPQI